MILSDLPVHREQADGFATFFKRHSPGSLATALSGFTAGTGPCVLSEKQALAAAHQRRKDFAQEFSAMVRHCAVKDQKSSANK
jgi:hypothetical protein